jgi:hypothetical protein
MLEISIGTHQVYRCVNRGEGKDLTEGKQQIAAHDQGEEKPLTPRRLADLATDMRCSGAVWKTPKRKLPRQSQLLNQGTQCFGPASLAPAVDDANPAPSAKEKSSKIHVTNPVLSSIARKKPVTIEQLEGEIIPLNRDEKELAESE